MKRIAAVTQAAAFIVTGVLVLLALGLLVTKSGPGGPRAAIPELTLLGIAIVALLLAAKPYVDADAEDQPAPVEVRLSDTQVDLMAKLVDSLVLRTAGHHPGVNPIPNGVTFPQPGGNGVVIPESRRKRNAKHRADS